MKNKTLLILFILILILPKDIFCQTPVYYENFPIHMDTVRTPVQKAGIPLIADLDKDGQKEIITVGLDYNGVINPPVMLYIVRSDGSFYPNFPKGYNELILDIASGDVDGDGYLDIALRMTYSFDVIDRFGNHLPGFPVNYSDEDIDPTKFISLYDLDNDGKLEIIVSKTGEICVFNFNGTVRAGWSKYIAGRVKYNPAIGDIDNDGFSEIISSSFRQVNSSFDSGAVNIFRADGSIISNNWPIYFDSNYISWSSSPSLFINRNNSDSSFFVLPLDKYGSSSERLHKFIMFDIQGKMIKKSYQLAFHDFGTLVMGDLNGEGKMDYSSGTQYGNTLSAFDNNLNLMENWPTWGNGEHYATSVIGKVSNNDHLNIIDNRWSAQEGTGDGYIYAYDIYAFNLPWSPLRPHGISKAISMSDLNNDGSVELVTTTFAREGFFIYAWTIPGIPYTAEDFPWPQYGHDRYRSNQYGFIPPDEPVGINPISTVVPDKFILLQNYPNPFNPSTHLGFEIPRDERGEAKDVKLIIYDVLGKEVNVLINEKLSPGSYQVTFDGSDLSSGVYFYRLEAGQFMETKRMILLK